jgi:hypothetical protein
LGHSLQRRGAASIAGQAERAGASAGLGRLAGAGHAAGGGRVVRDEGDAAEALGGVFEAGEGLAGGEAECEAERNCHFGRGG